MSWSFLVDDDVADHEVFMVHYGPNDKTYFKQDALRFCIWVLQELADKGECYTPVSKEALIDHRAALQLALADSIGRVSQRRRAKVAKRYQAVKKIY